MTANKQQGNLLIFFAIIIAALIIGGALIWTRGGKNTNLSSSSSQVLSNSNPLDTIKSLKPDDTPTLGSPDAPIIMAIFSDFQCHFCKSFFENVKPALMEKYVKPGKIKMVFLDFPFLSEESNWAAQAARCANDQGKYWDYAEKLHSVQTGHDASVFGKENLKTIARNMSLDINKFNECFDSQKYFKNIQENVALAEKLEVDGTPTAFINGQKIDGAQSLDIYEKVIDNELQNLK